MRRHTEERIDAYARVPRRTAIGGRSGVSTRAARWGGSRRRRSRMPAGWEPRVKKEVTAAAACLFLRSVHNNTRGGTSRVLPAPRRNRSPFSVGAVGRTRRYTNLVTGIYQVYVVQYYAPRAGNDVAAAVPRATVPDDRGGRRRRHVRAAAAGGGSFSSRGNYRASRPSTCARSAERRTDARAARQRMSHTESTLVRGDRGVGPWTTRVRALRPLCLKCPSSAVALSTP